jgi:hypothetical protein
MALGKDMDKRGRIMLGRLSAVLLLGLLTGCKPQPAKTDFASLEKELAGAEAVGKRQAEATQEIARELANTRRQALQLMTELGLAEEEFTAARRMYEHASARASIAAEEFANARDNYQKASDNYRRIAAIIILAAASDALGSQLCDSTMSTRAFREQLRREGVVLKEGIDVDHIWPRALGGADHPANYQLLPSEVNRSLGASVWEKLMTSPLGVLQGLAASALFTLRCEHPWTP